MSYNRITMVSGMSGVSSFCRSPRFQLMFASHQMSSNVCNGLSAALCVAICMRVWMPISM